MAEMSEMDDVTKVIEAAVLAQLSRITFTGDRAEWLRAVAWNAAREAEKTLRERGALCAVPEPAADVVETVARAIWDSTYVHQPRLFDKLLADDGGLVPFGTQARAAIAAVSQVDPDLLRWCQWPRCLRSFNAVYGPRPSVEGAGWMRVRGTGTPVLLCPEHAHAGHHPGHRDWKPGDETLTATCQCGAEHVVRPTNQDAVMAWWREHIEQQHG